MIYLKKQTIKLLLINQKKLNLIQYQQKTKQLQQKEIEKYNIEFLNNKDILKT